MENTLIKRKYIILHNKQYDEKSTKPEFPSEMVSFCTHSSDINEYPEIFKSVIDTAIENNVKYIGLAFDEIPNHSDVASLFRKYGVVRSAGFLYTGGPEDVVCTGGSISLSIHSSPKDSELFKSYFFIEEM